MYSVLASDEQELKNRGAGSGRSRDRYVDCGRVFVLMHHKRSRQLFTILHLPSSHDWLSTYSAHPLITSRIPMPKNETTRVTRQARQRALRSDTVQPVARKASQKSVAAAPAKKQAAKTRKPSKKSAKKRASSPPLSEYEKNFLSCVVPGHVVTDLDTPEFDAACRRMEQAWEGTLPEGTEPPVYATHYSYLPEQYRIPQGTVIPPGVPVTSHGGTSRNINWSEETTDLALLAEFGSVELGRKWLRSVTEGADTIGVRHKLCSHTTQLSDGVIA